MTQENCKFLATDFETSRGKGKISLSDRYCVHFFLIDGIFGLFLWIALNMKRRAMLDCWIYQNAPKCKEMIFVACVLGTSLLPQRTGSFM